jgi:hypothetical protein
MSLAELKICGINGMDYALYKLSGKEISENDSDKEACNKVSCWAKV